MCKSVRGIPVQYALMLLFSVVIVVLAQKAESNINSPFASDVGHISRNNLDVKAVRENTHSAKSNAVVASYCMHSTFDVANINHPAKTKHRKKSEINPAYVIKTINVFTGKKNRRQFYTISTDYRCCDIVNDVQFSSVPIKVKLPISLPVIPPYKPKQTLRWHMII